MPNKQNLFDLCMARQDGKCALCGQPIVDRYHSELDRIVPGREGGKYVADNVRVICLECAWGREGNKPNSHYPSLAGAYRMYKRWQREAGAMDRKIRASVGDITGTSRSPYLDGYSLSRMADYQEQFEELEHEYEKRVLAELKLIPAFSVLKKGYGAGPLVLAHIMSTFNITIGKCISAIWAFFGYTPEQSAGAKGRNPGLGQLRSPLYASLSISLIRMNSPYRPFYDATKARLEARNKANGKLDKKGEPFSGHTGALQRTIKLWLSHLWLTWRLVEGLPITEPYAQGPGGHDNNGYLKPEDFGWPKVE